MSAPQERPSTRGGGKPGSSAGRPRTGRPDTASSRPITSAGRGGTAAGRRPMTGGVDGGEFIEEDDEEYEEEYESEDEGDVFAFVPPDLGPSPMTVQLDGPNVNVSTDAAPTAQQSTAAAALPTDEETFYYDEATGAVYDAQGKLVEMPAGFNPNAIPSSTTDQEVMQGMQGQNEQARSAAFTAENPSFDLVGGNPRAGGPSSLSLEPRQSFSSSVNRDFSVPILPHARAIAGFPVAVGMVDEMPQSRDGGGSLVSSARDVGMTAGGGQQIDELGRDMSGQLRKRTNRSSQFTDAAVTPTTELPFKLTGDSPYDEADEAYDLDDKHAIEMAGGVTGVAQPQIDFSGIDLGSKRLRMVELELETEEDSPYPEVRASVSNIDDTDMPCGTLRAWFLAFVLCTLAGGVNVVLSLRLPAPTLSPIVLQLVTYPCGKFLAAVLPIRTFSFSVPYWTPRSKGRYPVSFSLNPGLFNIKEHTLVTIVLNLVTSQAYALNCVLNLNSTYFYNSPKPVMFAILFTISSQMIGFAFAGVSRRFLVSPASMIWPQVLVITTLLNTLHAEEDGYDRSMTRFKYFLIVLTCTFFWEWVPLYIFTALSSFNWLCWIWPNSYFVNFLFGTNTGLGLSVLTFDWSQINYIGSPLVFPWWAECNIFGGYILWICVIGPAFYFANVLYTAYLPFNSATAFDNFGEPYNKTIIITPDLKFDEEAYRSYSPLFLPTTYILVYCGGFAVFTGILSHTALYHGKALWRGIKHRKTEEDDVHAKFMRRYSEVPEWWYFLIGVVMCAFAIITIEVYEVGLPIWAFLVSIAIPAVYFLPSGFIFAMTGTAIGTNLISEVVAGYAFPGVPIANMVFKVYSYMGLAGGLSFVQDLKLGHYMKVPPRQSFSAQVVFSVWIALVQIAVLQFMTSSVADLCDPQQVHNFKCPQTRVFFTSSVFWGVIGPGRLFGETGLYAPLYWAMLIGLLLPVPFWLLARRFPKSWIKFVSVPIILNSAAYIPPAGGIVYTAWFAVAFVFQYLIRRLNFRWWSKYNFVTSAALDSATILSTIFIFLALQLPRDGSISLNWWGNNVAYNNLDSNPVSWRSVPPQGFGPGHGG